jgi:hypothetical protein
MDTLALPNNVDLGISTTGFTSVSNSTGKSFILSPEDQIFVEIEFDSSERPAGRDTSSIVFAVSADPQFRGCSAVKIKYDIVANLSLSTNENHLGPVAAFGYTCATLIIIASMLFASWVRVRRKTRVVSTMQPFFLVTLCIGVLLIGLTLIPLSIDDGVASQKGCDIGCMARPWLLSIGFTLCVSALFSKLLRINKLFHSQQFRRIKVREKDVMCSTSMLVVLNIMFNVVWTAVDPLKWERVAVKGQPYITYGKCSLGDGVVGRVMLSLVVSLCAISFIMTCWQAFRARNISSEFSESKYLGIAIYSWSQLCLVGVPVLYLVDDSNVLAKYSLVVGLIFALCMSMLLVVFVPIMIVKKKRGRCSIDAGSILQNAVIENGFPGSLLSSGSAKEGPNSNLTPNQNLAIEESDAVGAVSLTPPHEESKSDDFRTQNSSTDMPNFDTADVILNVPSSAEIDSGGIK